MSNTTSQSKIFIDIDAQNATQTLGPAPGAAIWLTHFTNFKVTDERSVEIVKAVGVKGGAGFRRKTGGGSISATETRQDVPQVDWRQMRDRETVFMLMAQDENDGMREKWFNVTVSKVDRTMDDESKHEDEIEFKFLSSIAR